MDNAQRLGALALTSAEQLTRRHVGVVVAAVAVAVADGHVGFAGAGNTARGGTETPGTDTLFEIGSVTKTFTSLALAPDGGRRRGGSRRAACQSPPRRRSRTVP
ncbi:serine hydrolase [Streptomyces sp. NPDC059447]|uniref:serine hydrolase n=1 Tax=Streptomyces sp. NPDC059447 TaxID=3346834 RepID=UPI003688B65E